MSRSDQFVDEDATTLEFAVPVRARHTERTGRNSVVDETGATADGAVDQQPGGDASARSDVISADEAATILGVCRWALYGAANRHEVPHRRLGRRMLFSRRALLLWLEGASPRGVGKE